MEELLRRGADLSYNDPHVPDLPKMRHHPSLPVMTSIELTPETLTEQDCVLIATDHSAYDYEEIVKYSKLIIDTRNATNTCVAQEDNIRKA